MMFIQTFFNSLFSWKYLSNYVWCKMHLNRMRLFFSPCNSFVSHLAFNVFMLMSLVAGGGLSAKISCPDVMQFATDTPVSACVISPLKMFCSDIVHCAVCDGHGSIGTCQSLLFRCCAACGWHDRVDMCRVIGQCPPLGRYVVGGWYSRDGRCLFISQRTFCENYIIY